MENEMLKELRMENRAQAVAFLKSLWLAEPQPCPLCGGRLEYLHRKAKKSNSDWRCTACGKVYRAISILQALPPR